MCIDLFGRCAFCAREKIIDGNPWPELHFSPTVLPDNIGMFRPPIHRWVDVYSDPQGTSSCPCYITPRRYIYSTITSACFRPINTLSIVSFPFWVGVPSDPTKPRSRPSLHFYSTLLFILDRCAFRHLKWSIWHKNIRLVQGFLKKKTPVPTIKYSRYK